MADEWGPWIEHDGRGCPLPAGTIGEAELRCQFVASFVAQCGSTRGGPFVVSRKAGSAWVWGSSAFPEEEVLRYRVRKPRGMVVLESLLAELPERVDA